MCICVCIAVWASCVCKDVRPQAQRRDGGNLNTQMTQLDLHSLQASNIHQQAVCLAAVMGMFHLSV